MIRSTLLTLILALAPASVVGTAHGADRFPDEWFFEGANRPAALRDLEGKPAPELAPDQWIGDSTTLESLRGRVVVLDFWATWCGPCMAAIPENVEMVSEMESQGLSFIGVHDAMNGWDRADAVVKDKKINYPVVLDRKKRDSSGRESGESTLDYKVSFWPTYVVIDRHGLVRAAGLIPAHVKDVVKALLAESGPAPQSAAKNGEFPAEWFAGGVKRSTAQQALEGSPLPVIDASQWRGERAKPDDRRDRVTVICFLAPWSTPCMRALPKLKELEEVLASQGVVFIALCDHSADWEAMKSEFDRLAFKMTLALDAAPADPGERLGATSARCVIRTWPSFIVADRKGIIRAAGVKLPFVRSVAEKLMAESGG